MSALLAPATWLGIEDLKWAYGVLLADSIPFIIGSIGRERIVAPIDLRTGSKRCRIAFSRCSESEVILPSVC